MQLVPGSERIVADAGIRPGPRATCAGRRRSRSGSASMTLAALVLGPLYFTWGAFVAVPGDLRASRSASAIRSACTGG